MNDRDLIEAVRIEAQPLTGVGASYDYLLGLIGDARFVLLGEASHGTHEFYEERAHITQRAVGLQALSAVDVAQYRGGGIRRVAAPAQRRAFP
jgi:erythromycin esterase-like protein